MGRHFNLNNGAVHSHNLSNNPAAGKNGRPETARGPGGRKKVERKENDDGEEKWHIFISSKTVRRNVTQMERAILKAAASNNTAVRTKGREKSRTGDDRKSD